MCNNTKGTALIKCNCVLWFLPNFSVSPLSLSPPFLSFFSLSLSEYAIPNFLSHDFTSIISLVLNCIINFSSF